MKERERITKNEAKLKGYDDEARRLESREHEIAQDLQEANEEGGTINSRQEAAQAEVKKRQKEIQKIQVLYYLFIINTVMFEFGNVIVIRFFTL